MRPVAYAAAALGSQSLSADFLESRQQPKDLPTAKLNQRHRFVAGIRASARSIMACRR
jgi:hypothetical protein